MDNNKNKTTKKYIVASIVLTVLGVSLGFLALSRTYTIKKGVYSDPNRHNFRVEFSSKSNLVDLSPITPIKSSSSINASNATIDNSSGNPLVKDISVQFTQPHQSVTYIFFAYNSGKYNTYLNDILFNNYLNSGETKVCKSDYSIGNYELNKVCDSVILSIKVGDENTTGHTVRNIDYHILPKKMSDTIILTISYIADDMPNSPVKVNFGDIKLLYESID